jgi:hypothetical protein
MAQPLMRFAARRYRSWAATAAIVLALAFWFTRRDHALRDTAFLSGWLLLLAVLFLLGLNLRKKFPHPPLLRASTWLQLHLYVGLTAVALFALHVGWRMPHGVVGVLLAGLFVLAAASGMVGIALSRAIPERLSVLDTEVIFERIPTLRRELRERAETLLVETARAAGATTLVDFYRAELQSYFAAPAHRWRHLLLSRSPLRRREQRLAALGRYLTAGERANAGALLELIRDKDDLDHHHALQGALRIWLFVHIPASYGLLLVAAVHAVVVYAFAGSLQ